MANSDPDSTDVFECNLVDNFYSNGPCELENVCLYDFVKWYIYNGMNGTFIMEMIPMVKELTKN